MLILTFIIFIKGYGGIPTGDRNDQIQLSTCTPVATADEIDPETLIPPQWGTTWTLPEAHEILIGPKNDPFCFVVFPGADSVSEIFWYILKGQLILKCLFGVFNSSKK